MTLRIKALTLLILTGWLSMACLWDTDTIAEEERQFPDALELMSGKFLRHGPEYHYWRSRDREMKITQYPDSLPLYDDLAVSYDKLGRDDLAIAVMQKKDAKKSGLYETEANLGTFYLHDGNFEEGLKHIRKAIEINPDAHFGREKYQAYLAEYLMEGKQRSYGENVRNSFMDWVLRKGRQEKDSSVTRENALQGILGMMRFGNYRSPALLHAFADGTIDKESSIETEENDLWHGVIARLMGALGDTTEAGREKVWSYTERRMEFMRNSLGPADMWKVAMDLMQEGDAFFDSIRADEIAWIKAGNDPEKAFAKKYFEAPQLVKRSVFEKFPAYGDRNPKWKKKFLTYRRAEIPGPDLEVLTLIDGRYPMVKPLDYGQEPAPNAGQAEPPVDSNLVEWPEPLEHPDDAAGGGIGWPWLVLIAVGFLTALGWVVYTFMGKPE